MSDNGDSDEVRENTKQKMDRERFEVASAESYTKHVVVMAFGVLRGILDGCKQFGPKSIT